MPATRNEVTRSRKLPKVTAFAELAIGTAIATSHERLRTQTQRRANTPSTPRPPEWNGNPCYAFRKLRNIICNMFVHVHKTYVYSFNCTCQDRLQLLPCFWGLCDPEQRERLNPTEVSPKSDHSVQTSQSVVSVFLLEVLSPILECKNLRDVFSSLQSV